MNELSQENLIVNSLNNANDLHNENFTYQSIFLSSIAPDKTNARFMPAVLIKDDDAQLFIKRKISKKQLVDKYHIEDKVIIGKSCIINCLDYGSY